MAGYISCGLLWSARPRREVLGQETLQQAIEVTGGARTFVDAVGTVGVGHHGKGLFGGDERVDERLRALVMDVVIPRAVDDQELALELPGERDGRTLPVLIRMILWQPAIPLLIDRVVVAHIGDRRDRHA